MPAHFQYYSLLLLLFGQFNFCLRPESLEIFKFTSLEARARLTATAARAAGCSTKLTPTPLRLYDLLQPPLHCSPYCLHYFNLLFRLWTSIVNYYNIWELSSISNTITLFYHFFDKKTNGWMDEISFLKSIYSYITFLHYTIKNTNSCEGENLDWYLSMLML